MLLLLCALSGCAPANIPAGAMPHWALKGGLYWTWTRTSDHGCAAWMAKSNWASVQILVHSKCKGVREAGYLPGHGLLYSSVEDELVFLGYWPWSQEEYSRRLVSDEAGMIKGVLPCPYDLSAQQINAMQIVAREAEAGARTDGEKRVLSRVARRLAALRGRKLSSSQSGCSDRGDAMEANDVWIRP